MYGILGGSFIIYFLLKPLFLIIKEKKQISTWYPITLGYILFLIACGSNPYLINSTGLITIATIYSIAYNPIYRDKALIDQ